MKALHMVAFVLVVIGGLNWLLVGFGFNLVESILGMGMITKVIYILVGISAVYLAISHKKDCKCCDKGAGAAPMGSM